LTPGLKNATAPGRAAPVGQVSVPRMLTTGVRVGVAVVVAVDVAVVVVAVAVDVAVVVAVVVAVAVRVAVEVGVAVAVAVAVAVLVGVGLGATTVVVAVVWHAVGVLMHGRNVAVGLFNVAVFVMIVPAAVPGFTLTTSVNVTVPPPAGTAFGPGLVQVIGPVPPAGGVMQAKPAGAAMDTKVVLAGVASVNTKS